MDPQPRRPDPVRHQRPGPRGRPGRPRVAAAPGPRLDRAVLPLHRDLSRVRDDAARPDARAVREGVRPGLRRAPDARPLRPARRTTSSACRRRSRRRSCTRSGSRWPRGSGARTRSPSRSWARGAPTRATSTRRSTSRRSTGCPFVFIVENNGYAISVPAEKRDLRQGRRDAGVRATASRASSSTARTCSPATRAGREAVDRARSGGGPTLIEAKVTRLTAHSSDDQQTKYRSENDLAEGRAHDPLPIFRAQLREAGVLTDAIEAALAAEIRRRSSRTRPTSPRPSRTRTRSPPSTGSTRTPRRARPPPPWHPAGPERPRGHG